MNSAITALTVTAASMGFFHTLVGPDHYIPFIVMSEANKWSHLKTIIITTLCGLGHVLSSVVLGLFGVGLGIALFNLTSIESVRGELAGWALIAFGLAYGVISLRRVVKGQEHTHGHAHGEHSEHEHPHSHEHEHAHVHKDKRKIMTPWVLFVIFVLGPCEPLIPILMYPAAEASIGGMLLVTTAFSFATLATMLTMVMVLRSGIKIIPMRSLHKYAHVLAGFSILICGLLIQLGL